MINQLTNGTIESHETIQNALKAVREHLGMEVAYISEFVGAKTVFRVVDAPGLEKIIKVGDTHDLDDVYCRHILEGRLPELMADTAEHSLALAMPITQAVPIGAHMSVAIRTKNGDPIGMFCCLSPHADKSLNARDLRVMRVFADMAAGQMANRISLEEEHAVCRERIENVLETSAFRCVYQPIWDLTTLEPIGFEALCRFSPEPLRTPDIWFKEAFDVGLGEKLELAALETAFQAFDHFPEGVYLSINASPSTIVSGALPVLLSGFPRRHIVLEITEHASVVDYTKLCAALAPLRSSGVRLAIDDAGAGYASLQHIVRLSPDAIKLDISLTRGVNVDTARRALAAALVFFCKETDSMIIAEGIETSGELDTLKSLGVPFGQGYLLGRPLELTDAENLVRSCHANGRK